MKKLFAILAFLSLLIPQVSWAAIAFDSAMDRANSSANPATATFTNTAGTVALVAFTVNTTTDIAPTVTYGGQSMTQLAKQVFTANTSYIYVYGITHAPTGSNTISISYSGSQSFRIEAASYTGVDCTNFPDATHTNAQHITVSPFNYTDSITTIADNSWATMFFYNNVNASFITVGGVSRQSVDNNPNYFDSNTVKHPAGSYSMTAQWGGGGVGDGADIMVSLAPGTCATATAKPTFFGLFGYW